MCLCLTLIVTAGLLLSQVRWIMVVANVLLWRIAPVKVWIFLTPDDVQPDDEAYDLLPGRRLIEAGGKDGGHFANQSDFRSRSKSRASELTNYEISRCFIYS